jgi:hypothetical protein
MFVDKGNKRPEMPQRVANDFCGYVPTHVANVRCPPSYVADIQPGHDELLFQIRAGNMLSSRMLGQPGASTGDELELADPTQC